MELRDKKSDREESRRASSVRARGDREEERGIRPADTADRRKKIVKVRGEGEEGGVTREERGPVGRELKGPLGERNKKKRG